MSVRRPWAWPLVPLYAAGAWVREKLRAEPGRLEWPVVSVGSLSAGGAGKTPVVIALAELLRTHGLEVDVLTRGYRRAGKEPAPVAAAVPAAAEIYGDEPVLIARRTGAPVWVYGDRHVAGRYAEEVSPGAKRIHLLDDGFQHRGLARDFDIALVTLEDVNDVLLPAGNLREGLKALARADAIVVRDRERERVALRVKPYLRAGTPVWVIQRRLRFESPLAVLGAGLRPLAFCAIARPEDFAAMVQAAGCGIVDTVVFRDHHRYEMRDIEAIVDTARKLGVTGFVTTEKDAVKLTPEMREGLAAVGPLLVARLDVTFADPAQVLADIEARIP
jgi:tetraacyldisaccharide 4'-kinase